MPPQRVVCDGRTTGTGRGRNRASAEDHEKAPSRLERVTSAFRKTEGEEKVDVSVRGDDISVAVTEEGDARAGPRRRSSTSTS